MHQALINAAADLRSTAEAKRKDTDDAVAGLVAGRSLPGGLLAGMAADLVHAEACDRLAKRLEKVAAVIAVREIEAARPPGDQDLPIIVIPAPGLCPRMRKSAESVATHIREMLRP